MVNAVHVRRYYQLAEPAINWLRDRDIAVVEHGCCIEDDLEGKNGESRSSCQYDGSQFDSQGEDDF